jgi:hypothetical protein
LVVEIYYLSHFESKRMHANARTLHVRIHLPLGIFPHA